MFLRKRKVVKKEVNSTRTSLMVRVQPNHEMRADAPVPGSLNQKRNKDRSLLAELKQSQKIGLLLWLNRMELISQSGSEKLILLQRVHSVECLEAAISFLSRLENEKKLQSDFKPHMEVINRLPLSRRGKQALFQSSRIGIGYRDKGTLLTIQEKARKRTNEEAFVSLTSLPPILTQFVEFWCPSSVVDGEWIDLGEVREFGDKLSRTFI